MSGSRIALVADDQRLASAIQIHLKKNLNQAVFLSKFDAIRTHMGRDTNGVLILTAANAGDCEQLVRLVQEIHLQKYPVTILIVGEEGFAGANELTTLDSFICKRLTWPRDMTVVSSLVQECTSGRVQGFLATCEEPLQEIIGNRLLSQTPSLLPMVDRIALAATHSVTVLLTGETGTGKSYLAKLMHDCSPRRSYPFLTVPCGAQPANLVESAFFGHMKGAFTGADRVKVGKFAAAGHGTILLDEIDTLGLEQQASLLRVIETGEYEPVGSNETSICNARILVASNWDLEEAVERGRFRRDLYYRLNVMSFHLPPLRERVQDIGKLARGMAAHFNTKFRKDLLDIHPEALAALEMFPWPGNIRQLENVIQQGVLVSSGTELRLEHLPQPVREYMPAPNNINGHAHHADSLMHNRELIERNVIQRALANNGFSRARAASALGISRVTLYKKMKKYNLMNVPLRPARV